MWFAAFSSLSEMISVQDLECSEIFLFFTCTRVKAQCTILLVIMNGFCSFFCLIVELIYHILSAVYVVFCDLILANCDMLSLP